MRSLFCFVHVSVTCSFTSVHADSHLVNKARVPGSPNPLTLAALTVCSCFARQAATRRNAQQLHPAAASTMGERVEGYMRCGLVHSSDSPLVPKCTSIPGINERGSFKLCKSRQCEALQWAIYYTMKQHLETMLYKPVCHCGFKVSCARTYPHSYDILRNRWSIAAGTAIVVPLHLTQFVSTLCSNCHNRLLARHAILQDFL